VLKFAGRAGLAAAAVGVTEWGINALNPDDVSDWSQWDSLGTIAASMGGYAAAGAAIGGPVGAVVGTGLGFVKGSYDALQKERESGNIGIANAMRYLSPTLYGVDWLLNRNKEYDSPKVDYAPSYAEGEWFVSKDEQANIHYGEMVLPNRVAQAVRDEMSRGRTAPSSSSRGSGGSPQVVINLSIQRASEREAIWLAGRVKGLIESDDELVSIGAGRFG
jgi:hypothetical protein